MDYNVSDDLRDLGAAIVRIDDRCTGIAVHPRLVLYPAHCGTRVYRVRAGALDIVPIACKAHPRAFETHAYDIAWCKLSSETSRAVAPSSLTEPKATDRGVALLLHRNGAAQVAPSRARAVSGDEFKLSTTPEICEGDSGSPLVVAEPPALLGLLSTSLAPGCTRGVDLFAVRLSAHLPWIEESAQVPLSALRPRAVSRREARDERLEIRGLSDGSLRYRFESFDSRISVTRPGAELDFVEVSVRTSAMCPTAYRDFDGIAPFEFTLKLPPGRCDVDVTAHGGGEILALTRAVSVDVQSPVRGRTFWLAALALAAMIAMSAGGAFLYRRLRGRARQA